MQSVSEFSCHIEQIIYCHYHTPLIIIEQDTRLLFSENTYLAYAFKFHNYLIFIISILFIKHNQLLKYYKVIIQYIRIKVSLCRQCLREAIISSVNQGSQSLGWKFSTPLQADYLNTFIAGLSSPGLLTRPKFDVNRTSAGADVIINQFSLLVVPTDKVSTYKDENNEIPIHRLVKMTTNTLVTLSITQATVAIGFTYSFANESVTQSQWFGDFVILDSNDIANFEGVIIATCQCFISSNGTKNYSVSTSGADISDMLLFSEGWNPNKWLSLVSPRRAASGILNRLEVRKHNGLWSGYISGHAGLDKISNCTYTFDTNVHAETNPDGIRGFMPGNYNAFKLQSDGFSLCKYADTLPITEQNGGVFALVNASAVNLPPQGTGNDVISFSNKLKIIPVIEENLNVYYKDNILYIQ